MERETVREGLQFCQKPSQRYMQMLEECGDDPRVVAGTYVLNRSMNAKKGWTPDFDARGRRDRERN